MADQVPAMLNDQNAYWGLQIEAKLGGRMYHNYTIGIFKIHLCLLHTGRALGLADAVSLDVLHNASHQNFADRFRSSRC